MSFTSAIFVIFSELKILQNKHNKYKFKKRATEQSKCFLTNGILNFSENKILVLLKICFID